ncbi:Uncharacterised protein [Mycobacteroides abscessus subsp. abscessus]|nr:Uncharacterised protein [Mycobacteroides abscessus subsp. abscessus]
MHPYSMVPFSIWRLIIPSTFSPRAVFSEFSSTKFVIYGLFVRRTNLANGIITSISNAMIYFVSHFPTIDCRQCFSLCFNQ